MKELEKRAKSLEFNPWLKETCSKQIKSLQDSGKCTKPPLHTKDGKEGGPELHGTLLLCLVQFLSDIEENSTDGCKLSVVSLAARMAADVRAVPTMEHMC